MEKNKKARAKSLGKAKERNQAADPKKDRVVTWGYVEGSNSSSSNGPMKPAPGTAPTMEQIQPAMKLLATVPGDRLYDVNAAYLHAYANHTAENFKVAGNAAAGTEVSCPTCGCPATVQNGMRLCENCFWVLPEQDMGCEAPGEL